MSLKGNPKKTLPLAYNWHTTNQPNA